MTAADALREHDERPPDLLVTDLGLPGMDGLELLQTIRTKSPNIPAVAVTGYARLGDRARAMGAGFQAHVSKPIRSGVIRAGAGGCRSAERIARRFDLRVGWGYQAFRINDLAMVSQIFPEGTH